MVRMIEQAFQVLSNTGLKFLVCQQWLRLCLPWIMAWFEGWSTHLSDAHKFYSSPNLLLLVLSHFYLWTSTEGSEELGWLPQGTSISLDLRWLSLVPSRMRTCVSSYLVEYLQQRIKLLDPSQDYPTILQAFEDSRLQRVHDPILRRLRLPQSWLLEVHRELEVWANPCSLQCNFCLFP